jgi:hypothetical protein
MLESGPVLRRLAWLLFALLTLRFVAIWADAFAGAGLPVPGSIGFTLMFTAFSVLHAASILGWAPVTRVLPRLCGRFLVLRGGRRQHRPCLRRLPLQQPARRKAR